ncbi:hypothetical protein D9M71_540090 [compost metagenome]
MKYEINPASSVQNTLKITHVTDIKFQLWTCVPLAHVVLLLFIATKNANLRDIRVQERLQNCVPKRTGATSDHQRFASKHTVPHEIILSIQTNQYSSAPKNRWIPNLNASRQAMPLSDQRFCSPSYFADTNPALTAPPKKVHFETSAQPP